MKIAVIGTGYSGISNAVLLMQANDVNIVKTETVDLSVLNEYEIVSKDELSSAIVTMEEALDSSEYVFICVPVVYDTELNRYQTYDIEKYISMVISFSPDALIVIRSDVPIGYTSRIKKRYNMCKIIYCPDFSREGQAISDSINPSRIIIGEESDSARVLAELISNGKNVETIYMNADEAESIKLFSNTYLAMRVAFFNELDTYAELRGFNSEHIIKGVSSDPRIGNLYNNPSFGYGGRYLTEGSKKSQSNLCDIPQRIVKMVDESNEVRKDHITEMILKRNPSIVGIYRLSMKTGSKDFKFSSVEGVMRRLQAKGVNIIIYEPMIEQVRFQSAWVIKDLGEFKRQSDVIVANRIDRELDDVMEIVYSRDLFRRD